MLRRLLVIGFLIISASLLLTVTVFTAPPSPTPSAATPEPLLSTPVSLDSGGISLSYTGCGGVIAPVVNADFEQEVVDLVNAKRAAFGLSPLTRVTELTDAARYHATDMGRDDYFDHDSHDRVDGSLVRVCGAFERIDSYYSGWVAMGENIAAGYTSPQQVMDVWMGSSGHRANILSDTFTEIGVGYFEGSGYYYRYWVQTFGRPSGDADPTPTPTVTPSPAPCLDFNGDGQVTVADAEIVADHWQTADPSYDLDDDGKVTIIDVMKVGAAFGLCP